MISKPAKVNSSISIYINLNEALQAIFLITTADSVIHPIPNAMVTRHHIVQQQVCIS